MNTLKAVQWLGLIGMIAGAVMTANVTGFKSGTGATIVAIAAVVKWVAGETATMLEKKNAVSLTVQTDTGPTTVKLPSTQVTPPASP